MSRIYVLYTRTVLDSTVDKLHLAFQQYTSCPYTCVQYINIQTTEYQKETTILIHCRGTIIQHIKRSNKSHACTVTHVRYVF